MVFSMRVVAAALAISLAIQPLRAAGCINGNPSVQQEFANAKFVVLARAHRIKKNVNVKLPYGSGTYQSRVMVQTVAVVTQFKGKKKRYITYLDEYSSAQFPMKLGDQYILFFVQRNDGSLYIDVCGNSDRINRNGNHVLNQLRMMSQSLEYRHR